MDSVNWYRLLELCCFGCWSTYLKEAEAHQFTSRDYISNEVCIYWLITGVKKCMLFFKYMTLWQGTSALPFAGVITRHCCTSIRKFRPCPGNPLKHMFRFYKIPDECTYVTFDRLFSFIWSKKNKISICSGCYVTILFALGAMPP